MDQPKLKIGRGDGDRGPAGTSSGSSLKVSGTGSVQKLSEAVPGTFYYAPPAFAQQKLPSEPFKIEALPELGEKPELDWIRLLSTPIIMGILGVVMFYATGMNMTYMLAFQVVGVISGVVDYFVQTGKFKKNNKEMREVYSAILNDSRSALSDIAEKQRRVLNESNPRAEQCIELARVRQRPLWCMTPAAEEGFMTAAVGIGTANLCVPVEVNRGNLYKKQDPLEEEAILIADRYSVVENCPITVNLSKHTALAICGEKTARLFAARRILMDLTTTHSYETLQLVLIYDKEDREDWKSFRSIPHVWKRDKSVRYIAEDYESGLRLLGELAQIRKNRLDEAQEYRSVRPQPWYLVVLTSADMLHSIEKPAERLLSSGSAAAMSFMLLCEDTNKVPLGFLDIIEAERDGKGKREGRMYPVNDRENSTVFSIDFVGDDQVAAYAEALAPVRLRAGTVGKGLPPSISFLEGNGVMHPKELHIRDRWKEKHPDGCLPAVIGVLADGSNYSFDISPMVHGPSGLMAGVPGTGKTELLQTYVLALSTRYSPEEVNILLLDFKGSGLTAPFLQLPHLAGAVSDLDLHGANDFTLRYSAALMGEKARRERILNDAGTPGNISKYHKKYCEEGGLEPLPKLIIILDEFAEIKQQYPEFMKVMETFYATGRSLGMYVLLASQNPVYAISEPIRTNTAFGLCLRVNSNTVSKEMVGDDSAALLSPLPGRMIAYENKNYTRREVQSFFSGAVYDSKASKRSKGRAPALVAADGSVTTLKKEKRSGLPTEVDAVVEEIISVNREIGLEPVHLVFLPPLGKELPLYGEILPEDRCFNGRDWENPQDLTAVFGLVDDPAAHRQVPCGADFTKGGNAVVFGMSGCGKTILLQTALLSLTERYDPRKLRLYLADCNAGALEAFKDFPHTAQYMNGFDGNQAAQDLLTALGAESRARRERFMQAHAYDIAGYKAACPEDPVPEILVVIDNVGNFVSGDYGIRDALGSIAKDGPGRGIHLLVSAGEEKYISFMGDAFPNSQRFVLNMQNKGDYRTLLGLSYGSVIPDTVKGRGVLRSDSKGLEFQTALPTAVVKQPQDQRTKMILERGRAMQAVCEGMVFDDRPKELPEKVPFARSDAGISLGLVLPDGAPFVLTGDENGDHTVLVAGSNAEDRAKMLKLIAAQWAGRPTERVLTFGRAVCSEIEAAVIDSPEAFDAAIEKLVVSVVRPRNEAIRSGAEITADPVLVFVEDLPALLHGVSETTADRLNRFIVYGKRWNVYLYMAGTADRVGALREAKDGIVSSAFQRTVLLLPEPDGNSLLISKEKQTPLPGPADAWYLTEDGRRIITFRRMEYREEADRRG